MASYREELEKRGADGIPSLDDVESGKLVGAVLPMSEKAQIQMRNSSLATHLALQQFNYQCWLSKAGASILFALAQPSSVGKAISH